MLAPVIRIYREAFSGLPRDVWLLSAVALVNRAGTMVLPFLSLYLVTELGRSPAEAAAVLLCFGLGSVAGSFLGGWASHRIGPVRVQLLSLISGGAAFLLLIPLRSTLMLEIGFFLAALLSDAFRPAAMSACSDRSPPGSRTRGLALLRLAVNVGMALGPAVGGLLASVDFSLIFIVDGLTCGAAALVLWRTVPATGPVERERSAGAETPPSPVWTDLPFIAFLGLVFLLALGFFQIWVTLPLYYHDAYGLDERTIGLLISINAGVIVLLEMVLLKLVERADHMRLFGIGALFVGGGIALLPLGTSITLAVISTLTWTLGEMLSLPLSNGLVARRAGRGGSARHMGLYSLTFSVAFVLAPPAGIAIYEKAGGSVLCASVGAIGLLVLAGSLLLSGRFNRAHRDAPPE